MAQPRIRHIAINVRDREASARYFESVFGMEVKLRGENGTIYLSDGYVGLALISFPNRPWGINHFGFHVDSVDEIEVKANTTRQTPVAGAVAESWIPDPEGNRVDVTEENWPI